MSFNLRILYVFSSKWKLDCPLMVDFNSGSLMRWHPSEPESCPEIVAACQKCRRGWRMHDHPHRAVVTQRQQLFPRRITGVPCTQ